MGNQVSQQQQRKSNRAALVVSRLKGRKDGSTSRESKEAAGADERAGTMASAMARRPEREETAGGETGLTVPSLLKQLHPHPTSSSTGSIQDLPSNIMPPAPATVPCQYRTGKTLGSGTYAIVKEAVHIQTGKYYACKVINKKLMEGREYMVRNEIAVLKRVSSGHPNIVTLHDYFETAHNLYLCFDLCTGGELFDRICAKGNYYEADAANLVRTIFKAVKYIHDCGIVHRDLKPENLIFRTPAEEADIMIADFGLSRIMDDAKLSMLTEICGTPGYMAPEIFKKTGHGKPVDVWAMGVITYFLLAGYTPFDRDTQQQEMEAIIRGDYRFEPEEYWANVSTTAKDFISECLTIDPQARPTAAEALQHKWLSDEKPHFVPDPANPMGQTDLLPHIQKAFDARKTFRKAVLGMMAMRRMSALVQHLGTDARKLELNIEKYKQESEKESLEANYSLVHHHNAEDTANELSVPHPEAVSVTPSAAVSEGAVGGDAHAGSGASASGNGVEKSAKQGSGPPVDAMARASLADGGAADEAAAK